MATTALNFHGTPALNAPIAASSIRGWLKGLAASTATMVHRDAHATTTHRDAHDAMRHAPAVDLAMEQAKLDGQTKARFWL